MRLVLPPVSGGARGVVPGTIGSSAGGDATEKRHSRNDQIIPTVRLESGVCVNKQNREDFRINNNPDYSGE
jgi:hypothetical protein